MNCLACERSNPDGNRFCGGCGAALERLCPSCEKRNPPDHAFCGGCGGALGGETPAPARRSPRDYTPQHLADKILTSRSAIEGERKHVTVLFADVKGSMDLADQVDAERWHGILDGFFRILTEGVHRFEGTVNQYTGDGIMALFGAPIAHEDHAQRACHAALHLAGELRTYANELRRTDGLNFAVRIGLNSGQVVVGKIGDDLRMDYTAQGHTVGLAQRMEQLAEPGTVYLTEHTGRLVEGYFRLNDLGSFELRGVAAALRVYELAGIGALRTRLAFSQARGFSRFVGRAREMDVLQSALEQSMEGSGQIVGVVGDAGLGKSRLCFEFVQRCRVGGLRAWEAHCPAHGRTIPMLPILELMRSFFGIEDHDDPSEARRKIAGSLVLLDDSFRDDIPLAFDFLHVPDPEQQAPPIDPEQRHQRLITWVRRMIEARSARETAVLLLDDLHWIDPESDAFLAEVIRMVGTTRTLTIVNFRPEYSAPWMSASNFQRIPLAPLGERDCIALLQERLGENPSLEPVVRQVLGRAAGNPFFTEELAHKLIQDGILEGAPGEYRLSADPATIALPATVQGVLAGRIDRLDDGQKLTLQTAAVIGREFGAQLLERVTDLPPARLDSSLRALADAELVQEAATHPAREYKFRHPLTHEVAYESLLGERRMSLHVSIAHALEALGAGRLDELAPLLAHHWDAAGEARQAARWYRRAGEWAAQRDSAAAIRHWHRVRELLRSVEDSEEVRAERALACREILFTSWRSGGEEETWRAVYDEGESLARESGDLSTLATLISGFAGIKGFRGEHRLQVELLEQSLDLARRAGDVPLEASLHQRLGFAWFLLGDHRRQLEWANAGIELCERDLAHAGQISGYDTYAFLLSQQGIGLCTMGRWEDGLRVIEQGRQRAIEVDDPFCQSVICGFLFEVYWLQSDVEGMQRSLRRPSGGVIPGYGHATDQGRLSIVRGDWEGALAALQNAVQIFETAGAARIELLGLDSRALLGQAALATGDDRLAQRQMEEIFASFERIPELGSTSFPALLRVAMFLGSLGEARPLAEARRILDDAVRTTRQRGIHAYEPLYLRERARLAAHRGDTETAEADLRQALRLFTDFGLTVRADEAAAELAKLERC